MVTAGLAYLTEHFQTERGTIILDDYTPTGYLFPSIQRVTWTDPQLGLTAAVVVVEQNDKTYHGTMQTWAMSVGGRRPSLASLVRRLTRSTLS
jgi:hypothetical protein